MPWKDLFGVTGFKRVVQNHDGPVRHCSPLHHISAKASIRSVSKLASREMEMRLPPWSYRTPLSHSWKITPGIFCAFLFRLFLICSSESRGVTQLCRRPGDLGCKGLRPSVCFCAEEKKGRKGRSRETEECASLLKARLKLNQTVFCVRQTEGRVAQTLAACLLFSSLLRDRGLCDASAL